jgi:hypothetical protein
MFGLESAASTIAIGGITWRRDGAASEETPPAQLR